MITLRKYNSNDWEGIDDAIEPFVPAVPEVDVLELAKRGLIITGLQDGKVVSCGGIVYTSDTEGTVWVKVGAECIKNSFGWARTILETFKLMKECVGDLKISTFVLRGFRRGEKMARLVGMKKTGETEQYNDNIYNKYTEVA